MSLDYAALWVLVIVNSLGILVLTRQLAMAPQYSRRSGPKVGSTVGAWSLETLDGAVRRSTDPPDAYTLLFVSSTCGPCHALFTELRAAGRPRGLLYIVAQGDAAALAKEATSEQGPLYDLLLVDGGGEVQKSLQVPGTPYAVAIARGRVEAAAVASTPDQLSRICVTVAGPGEREPSTA